MFYFVHKNFSNLSPVIFNSKINTYYTSVSSYFPQNFFFLVFLLYK